MRFRWIVAAALAVLATGEARADITYSYAADQSSINATASGQTFTVNVYLKETISGTSTSIVGNEGLFGTSAWLVQNGTPKTGDATLSKWVPNFTNTGNGSQNNSVFLSSPPGANSFNPNTTSSQGFAIASDAVPNNFVASSTTPTGNGTAVTPTPKNTPGTFFYFLGNLTVTSGAVGNTTTFALKSYDFFNNGTGQMLTNQGTDLNALTGTDTLGQAYVGADAAAAFNITVTTAAVPEPSSMLLCGLIACGGAYGAYRRRKATKAEAAPAA
jgi:hypothetical protein